MCVHLCFSGHVSDEFWAQLEDTKFVLTNSILTSGPQNFDITFSVTMTTDSHFWFLKNMFIFDQHVPICVPEDMHVMNLGRCTKTWKCKIWQDWLNFNVWLAKAQHPLLCQMWNNFVFLNLKKTFLFHQYVPFCVSEDTSGMNFGHSLKTQNLSWQIQFW